MRARLFDSDGVLAYQLKTPGDANISGTRQSRPLNKSHTQLTMV
jgi:hypothetical protein